MVRITGIASEALIGYQPVMIDVGKGIDYAVKACTAGLKPLGYADVPTEIGARVPIVTNYIRTNGYIGVGGVAYGDELTVDAFGNYIKYVLPAALDNTTVAVGATVTAYVNKVGPCGVSLETVSAGGVADILLY